MSPNLVLSSKTQDKLIRTCAPTPQADKMMQLTLGGVVTSHLQFVHSLSSLLAFEKEAMFSGGKIPEKDFHSLIRFWIRITWNRWLLDLRNQALVSPDVQTCVFTVCQTPCAGLRTVGLWRQIDLSLIPALPHFCNVVWKSHPSL